MTRTIALTSARGEVGSSAIAVQLAVQLAQRGQRVCLLDAARASTSLTGGDAVREQSGAPQAAQAAAALEALLIQDRRGFDILPGRSDTAVPGATEPARQPWLAASLAALDGYDMVLLDALGGIAVGLLDLVLASSELVVTVTPQGQRLSEGYALLKLLAQRQYPGAVSLLVTRASSCSAGERAFGSLRKAAHWYLDRPLALLGVVREDPAPRTGHGVESAAAHDLALVAAQLLGETRAAAAEGPGAVWPLPGELLVASAAGGEQPRRELQQQVEALEARVEELLGEIERMRGESEDIARLVVAPRSALLPVVSDIEAWLAARASGVQQLRLADASFPVYQLRRPDGNLLRVAVHGCDPASEQGKPPSTCS